MSSVFNILGLESFNMVIFLPMVVVFVAFILLIKLSVRKPENSKKSQSFKKQFKATTNKLNDDKLNNDKKDKINKEKKPSYSLAKNLDKTNIDTDKSKTDQKQTVATGKSPKKIVQTKQHHGTNTISTNNNLSKIQTNNKKQQDNFLNKEVEGDWQIVTTKKQKQHKVEETIIDANTVTKTNKNVNKTPNGTKTTKTKKVKKTPEKKTNLTTVIDEETSAENKEVSRMVLKENIQTNEIPVFTFNVSIPIERLIPETGVSNISVAAPTNPIVNVAFDELGDDGWTDSKPQKKIRRKALRE